MAISITVNGDPVSIETDSISVTDLLKFKNVDMPDMVSVELNGDILERSVFETTQVSDGDSVEFLYFMGGGSLLV